MVDSIPLALSNNRTLRIDIRTSARVKRFRLVTDIYGVRAVVPAGYSAEKLQDFIESKKPWIQRTSMYYDRLREKIGIDAENLDVNAIYFLGKRYSVQTVKDRQQSVTVSDNLGIITFHLEDRRRYRQHLRQWYRKQTSAIISERLPLISSRMNLAYNKVSIKHQRSRWGSCSKKRNLNFNLLLSAAPADVIDYVIIHELAHLVEFGHSQKFWDLVAIYDSEYKKHKDWLASHALVIN